MCFYSQLTKSAQELQQRFTAKFLPEIPYKPKVYSGFQYPLAPIIVNKQPEVIQLYHWGLIPFWAKDNSFRKYTLNARLETITEKPAYKSAINNRCLILVDGFFEWQWLDDKGKMKQKYLIELPQNEAFAFAGLWSEWLDKSTNELVKTYSILTTQANELMSKIHNSKKRMPVILATNEEKHWLKGGRLITQNDRLLATPI